MADVTIVMTPRERFNLQKRSLESLFAHTPLPYKLVVVDGGAPASVARHLRQLESRRRLTVIRRDHFLAPNEARNLALPHLEGEYVVFVDNDVLFADGWLEALVGCAEETDADIIAPLTCIGHPPHTVVHMAGGDISFHERSDGRRELVSAHRYMDHPLADVRDALKREPCDFAEFHCMFVRRSTLEANAPLDERLKTTREHTDFCMTAARGGARILFEPGSLVTYYAPPPLAVSDIPFYVHRWNDEWSVESMRHFMEKWNVWFDLEHRRVHWIRKHRELALEPWRQRLQPLLGWRRSHAVKSWAEHRLIATARRRRGKDLADAAPNAIRSGDGRRRRGAVATRDAR